MPQRLRPVALSVLLLGALAAAPLLACDSDDGGATDAAVVDTATPDTGAAADTSAPTAGCSLETEGAPCDDGDPCTIEDECSGGYCVGGGTLACSDPEPCRTGSCQPGVGCVYEDLPSGASCALSCFTRSTCQEGVCTPDSGSAIQCPEPADPCIDRYSCDSSTGQCTVPIYAPAGAECDRDEDLCTIDACDGAGACADTGALETCAFQSANNPCWTYSCVKQTGCVRSAFVEGASCDDLNGCTGGDVCVVNAAGLQTCLGTPLAIDDGNPCTNDACVAGTISHTPIDGIVCTLPDDKCVGAGLCDQGTCVTQSSVDCDDGDPCTTDSCLPATGACAHAPAADQTPCDDGDACTTLDRCVSGVCSGSAIANCCGNGVCEAGETCGCGDCEGQACDDGDACTAGDVCAGGQCAGSSVAGCCGNGVCEAGEGCECAADCEGQPCDDGNACTTGDSCGGGACQAGGFVANCCGNGLCEVGEACACAADCDGQACDDGDACTTGSTCGGGVCGGGAQLANCCGNGVCEVGEGCGCGDCDGEACDDGDACTTGSTCGGGVCQGGTPAADCCGNGTCDVGEDCTCADCDGESCSDHDTCTTGDVCVVGQCVGIPVDGCCDNGVCTAYEDCTCADCADEPECNIEIPEGFTGVADNLNVGGHGTLVRLDDEYLALIYTDVADPTVAPDHFKVRIARLVSGELQLGTPLVVSASMYALASNSTWLSDIGLAGAMGPDHFVFILRESGQGEQFRLFKRSGMTVTQVDNISPFSLTDWWAGHPLDATRYILRYRVQSSAAPVTYRALVRSGDSLSVSTYSRQRPGPSSFPGMDDQEPQTHSPLMRVGSSTFREIRGNYVYAPGYLASWKLSVSSNSSMSSSNTQVYSTSAQKTMAPLVVGNGTGSGVVFYRAYGDAWYWGTLNGTSSSYSHGGVLHEDVSWHTGQNRESTDGYVGGKYFLRGVNGTLYRFDSLSSQPAVVETGLDWKFCRNTPPLVSMQGYGIMMVCDRDMPLMVRVMALQ